MRSLDAAEIAVLQSGVIRARDFVKVVVRDRETGEPTTFGFWSDMGDVTAEVVDGLTGVTEELVCIGSGALVGIGPITLTSDLSIRPVDIELSPIHAQVEAALRSYDPRGGEVQIYRGFLDEAGALVAPAKARFVGYVDEAPIITPAEGGEGSAKLVCASHTRELTRGNPAVRSHEDQQLRDPGDTFFKDVATVGDWEIFWGQAAGSPGENTRGKTFLKSRELGGLKRRLFGGRS